jgi:hypothetical protein
MRIEETKAFWIGFCKALNFSLWFSLDKVNKPKARQYLNLLFNPTIN